MTTEEIARLRALCEVATPGPWEQAHRVGEPRALVAVATPTESLLALDRDGMAIMDQEADAAFIAAARAALPTLLDEVERLRGELADEHLRGANEHAGCRAALQSSVDSENALRAAWKVIQEHHPPTCGVFQYVIDRAVGCNCGLLTRQAEARKVLDGE